MYTDTPLCSVVQQEHLFTLCVIHTRSQCEQIPVFCCKAKKKRLVAKTSWSKPRRTREVETEPHGIGQRHATSSQPKTSIDKTQTHLFSVMRTQAVEGDAIRMSSETLHIPFFLSLAIFLSHRNPVNTHAHTRTHARTHTCTHPRMHAHIRARTHARMHTYVHARTHTRMHAHIRARTHVLPTQQLNRVTFSLALLPT